MLKHPAVHKSPLHPSALRAGDLTVGKRIVIYNLTLGIIDEAMIITKPHLDTSDSAGSIVVTIRNSKGERKDYPLESIGVIPDSFYGWDDEQFTIDIRKKHLLPKPDTEFTWPDPPMLRNVLHPTEKDE
ncbi:MAG TPA: hypothetical protein VF281_04685 [Candidatus Saccharimonadales bacterium]